MNSHPSNVCSARVATLCISIVLFSFSVRAQTPAPRNPLAWPAMTRETRPWTYWWWMASAVDQTNITRELRRYREVGLGGVHIIPIYGAKGFEDRFIDYLGPRWLEMLNHSVTEAHRLDMGVDMTTGSGWCFGGPRVTESEGTAQLSYKIYTPQAGEQIQRLEPKAIQAIMAFGPDGTKLDLKNQLNAEGQLNWKPPVDQWRVYVVSQRSSRQKVKRAAPGGEGLMLNPLSASSMPSYLKWFDEAFAPYKGARPRSMYHDSYEYSSSWAPDLFDSFKKRRGYALQEELPSFLADPKNSALDTDRVARVKSDYRETISDVIRDDYIGKWVAWSHANGFKVRNQAHGSPANLLDLYALADIPETEMFNKDRSRLISKLASSAAHVAGRPLVSSESGTWVKEHFTETLADVKYLLDDLFLSGVNHVFYHGTCYSPDEAGWPGWHFYASLEMNPRNSIWRDAPALNSYIARCQSVLQAGQSDNDVLLYWPIFDVWHNSTALVQTLTVHSRSWLEDQPVGHTAETLSRLGYAFDYISDRQLADASTEKKKVKVPGGSHAVIVVPPTDHMPLPTLRALLRLAHEGATVIFQEQLPADVPGLGDLEKRRSDFKQALHSLRLQPRGDRLREGTYGSGRVISGELEKSLLSSDALREAMVEIGPLSFVRRSVAGGTYYFIANRTEDRPFTGWVPLGRQASGVVRMDPLTGRTGWADTRPRWNKSLDVFLQLEPGESTILRCTPRRSSGSRPWPHMVPAGPPVELQGTWHVEFFFGGPELPSPYQTPRPGSWTEAPDTNAMRFAGTARYTLTFDSPPTSSDQYMLDFGDLAQSARIHLNGHDLGTLLVQPWHTLTGKLRAKSNLLEVEVTGVSANRIRDLDLRGVKWKTFYDINFVGTDYKPFDASKWPLTPCGLLGPVTLRPMKTVIP